MLIDSYEFGTVTVEGVTYDTDLIIFGDDVTPDWWRKEGHLLSPEDLSLIVADPPEILVVGCGQSAMMKISSPAKKLLKTHGIYLEAYDTAKAVERFNELSRNGVGVAAALHLTC